MGSVKIFVYPYKTIEKKIKTNIKLSFAKKNMTISAQWDTGASGSCISYDVVKKLGLIPIMKVPVLTPSGPGIYNAYVVDVRLSNDILIKNVIVCDSEIGDQGIGMLVGMDIIGQGDMAISNYNNRTIFSFRIPSYSDINFIKEMKK